MNAAKRFLKISRMDRVFFTNSGTEAIEGAIKAAKKYAYTRDGHAGHEIIAMQHSFHGRTLGALSVTGNAHYQEPFEPLMPGVKFAKFNVSRASRRRLPKRPVRSCLRRYRGKAEFIRRLRNF